MNQNHNLYLSPESIVLLYVDDILIFGRSFSAVTALKKLLSTRYSMVDLGEAKQYLGMHIERDHDARMIYLNQTRYITKILERFGMQDCKGISMPMEAATLLPCPSNPAKAIKWTEYQSKVGNVMYAMLGTCPDLAFTVSTLSKYNLCPITAHHSVMGRVLRYLQATKNTGMLYKGESKISAMPKPVCYTDSDWAGDRDKRRSTGGFVVMLCGGAVSWKTQKQDIVALSTTEAEYIALTEASKEVIWMRRLLRKIETRNIESYSTDIWQYHDDSTMQWEPAEDTSPPSLPILSPPTTICVDNQGAMKLADNLQFHNRTKHIDIRYHFVRDTLAAGEVILQHLPTADIVADVLTKPLPRDKHEKHFGAMGLHSACAKKTPGGAEKEEDFIMID